MRTHLRSRPSGLTLVEMLIAIAVMAILATLATPSFTALLYDSDRTTAVNSFIHAIFLARSEAIKRSGVVTLCKSSDGQTCSRAVEWNAGWIVFANNDRDEPPVRDRDERVLAVYEGWPRGRITSTRTSFSFRSYRQGVVNGTVIFCDPRGSAHARAIIINHAGRPRIARRDSSGRPLRCPTG